MKPAPLLFALATLLTPAIAFACGNSMYFDYAPSALDYVALAPAIAGLIVIGLRRAKRSTVFRELALIAASVIGTTGIGMLAAERVYLLNAWITAAALCLIPLLLSIPAHRKRRPGLVFLLASCTVLFGVFLTLAFF